MPDLELNDALELVRPNAEIEQSLTVDSYLFDFASPFVQMKKINICKISEWHSLSMFSKLFPHKLWQTINTCACYRVSRKNNIVFASCVSLKKSSNWIKFELCVRTDERSHFIEQFTSLLTQTIPPTPEVSSSDHRKTMINIIAHIQYHFLPPV